MIPAGLQELTTLRDWVRWGAASFEEANLCFGHGQADAWDEAVCLALHVLHVPLDESRMDWGMELSPEQRQRLDALIQRRVKERRPAAYLIGETRFAGLTLDADERALIPRSPIAELIEAQFRPWIQAQRTGHMLDLCTGGGCIAVASAVYMKELQVDAVDISEPALLLAGRNARLHDVGHRVRLIQSDLFETLGRRRYDLIVSNPPYVGPVEFATLPEEFQHEPSLGLLAEDGGFDIVYRILQQAPDYLNENGVLIVEVGHGWRKLEQRLPQVPFTWLEFERGGEGVFLLEGEGLRRAQTDALSLRPDEDRQRAYGS